MMINLSEDYDKNIKKFMRYIALSNTTKPASNFLVVLACGLKNSWKQIRACATASDDRAKIL